MKEYIEREAAKEAARRAECDATLYELQDFFCPNCGADMREV